MNALSRAAVMYVCSSGVSSRAVDSDMSGCYCEEDRSSRFAMPATRTMLHSPSPTGASWLTAGVVASAAAHLVGVIMIVWLLHPEEHHEVEIIDIELAPPPPKAEELPAEV